MKTTGQSGTDILVHSDDFDALIEEGVTENDTANTTCTTRNRCKNDIHAHILLRSTHRNYTSADPSVISMSAKIKTINLHPILTH